MNAHPTFGKSEELLLNIAEKRFGIEEDANKTLQQKATLVLATVGFFAAFLGQVLLKLTERWDSSYGELLTLLFLAPAVTLLFTAAFCLLPALLGTYSVPALPRAWHDHLKTTRAALKEDQTVEEQALHHLQHGYLEALIEATDKSSVANAAKTWWIERAAGLLKFAVPLAAFAVIAFLVQAID